VLKWPWRGLKGPREAKGLFQGTMSLRGAKRTTKPSAGVRRKGVIGSPNLLVPEMFVSQPGTRAKPILI